jgi:hypothetical protein
MSKKKNKKSFSDNLELLFSERMQDDNAQDNLSMLEDTSAKKEKGSTAAKTKAKAKKKSGRKSFSSNLEQFFKASIDGVLDGVVTDVQSKIVKDKTNKRVVGLDLLIRQTTKDNNPVSGSEIKSKTKRVTVVLDTQKNRRIETYRETREATITSDYW